MKFNSALVAAASGSIGGLTASHNRGGQYMRKRTVPVNPNTEQQQAVRNAMTLLSARWTTTLTDEERAAWSAYADAVGVTNVLGNSVKLTGLQWFNACNVPRIQAGLAIIDAAPTTYSLATLTPLTFAADASDDDVDVTFVNTDAWATAVGGALLIYASRPQSPSINYFKGPYRYAGKVVGAVSPPSSPATISLPFPVAEGQKVFFQARAVLADGRISGPFRLGVAAGA